MWTMLGALAFFLYLVTLFVSGYFFKVSKYRLASTFMLLVSTVLVAGECWLLYETVTRIIGGSESWVDLVGHCVLFVLGLVACLVFFDQFFWSNGWASSIVFYDTTRKCNRPYCDEDECYCGWYDHAWGERRKRIPKGRKRPVDDWSPVLSAKRMWGYVKRGFRSY